MYQIGNDLVIWKMYCTTWPKFISVQRVWSVRFACFYLQHTATHCNTLQHTATHCNTLQHTATECTICVLQSLWEWGLWHIYQVRHELVTCACDTHMCVTHVCNRYVYEIGMGSMIYMYEIVTRPLMRPISRRGMCRSSFHYRIGPCIYIYISKTPQEWGC